MAEGVRPTKELSLLLRSPLDWAPVGRMVSGIRLGGAGWAQQALVSSGCAPYRMHRVLGSAWLSGMSGPGRFSVSGVWDRHSCGCKSQIQG